MSTKNLSDYYPVYKDLKDQIILMPADERVEISYDVSDQPSEQPISDNKTAKSPVMLNAEELIDLGFKSGFTVFQIVVLLVKNAFEGHVYISFQIQPEQLFRQGTTLFQAKQELLISSFYNHFKQYKEGLTQFWDIICEKQTDLNDISFEMLVHGILINQIVRLPVSLFSSIDIQKFKSLPEINLRVRLTRFEMVLLGEHAVGEFEFMKRVNSVYFEKFKDCVQQLRIKKEIISHFQQRLALAHYPNIHTEEELDDLMYKKLIQEKLKFDPENLKGLSLTIPENNETSVGINAIKNKIKVLYRLVSKNCSEVHLTTEKGNSFPELTQIFLDANSIYNEPVLILSEAWFNYMRMMSLLSKLLIYRDNQGLLLADCIQLISDFQGEDIQISKEELKTIRKNLEDKLVTYRMKNYTDFRMKFVMDDEFTEIHKHYLQKQIEFIDEQILQMQFDIKQILIQKSSISILNSNI